MKVILTTCFIITAVLILLLRKQSNNNGLTVIIILGLGILSLRTTYDVALLEKDKEELTGMKPEVTVVSGYSSPVEVTAAHIPKDEIEALTGYVYMYSEEETDRAFYLNPLYEYTTYKEGLEVYISDHITGTIVHSEPGMFKVEIEDPTLISKGMSGNRVKLLYTEEEIAFVSAMDTDLTVICYTFR